MQLPILDDLYDPLLDDSEHACKSFQICMICMMHLWMILSMLVNHPKLDVLYDPLLDDYAASNFG